MNPARQSGIGLALAGAIVATWAMLHIYAVFFHVGSVAAGAAIMLALCWLNVGLFIIAHDAMHGSLAPRRLAINRWAGRIALSLYAGFSYDRLLPKHHAHHRHAGTADDPDFSVQHSAAFVPWYVAFLRQYFGLREFAVLGATGAVYILVLGAAPQNLLLFWALPAILSSLQLFLFGTYLPHRAGHEDFADRHRARSNDYGVVASLLSCFHFGYHHEHHRAPHVPWWRLPAERKVRAPDLPQPDRQRV